MTINGKAGKKIFVYTPFPIFVENLPELIQRGLSPEIYINADVLDRATGQEITKVRRLLSENALTCTIHGPFMDLSPGAVDKKIRELTCQRFTRLLELVQELSPRQITLHPGYDELRYRNNKDLWLENSLYTWSKVVQKAQDYGVRILVENVFDPEPDHLYRLFSRLNSPCFGHCLDIGHHYLFSRVSISSWLDALGPWLGEVHLHDNHGVLDEHLALGEGKIDFAGFFAQLESHRLNPTLVLECHTKERVILSLERLPEYLGK